MFHNVKSTVTRLVQWGLNRIGFTLVRNPHDSGEISWDMDPEFADIFAKTKSYSMTSTPNRYALFEGLKYVVRNQIPGDVVECGVWKGGSSMIAAMALQWFGSTDKNLWLYDTYSGMSEPTDVDIRSHDQMDASATWSHLQSNNKDGWLCSPLDEVKANMLSTGYPADQILFVKGKVEDTIPDQAPQQISLLRLDTDWYESTRHELEHLFPLLTPGGVLIIDDYGWWEGSRRAADEYFEKAGIHVLLNRVDVTCRLVIKQ